MRPPLASFALLVGASASLLPLVYLLVARGGDAAPYALLGGLLSMGLAWSGGCSLERRRMGTVRTLCGLGVLLPLASFAPVLPFALTTFEQGLLLACAVLSAGSLLLVLPARR